MPVGVTQLRMQVKDVASGHVGSVRGRVEVPPGWNKMPTLPGAAEAGAAEEASFLTRDLPLLAALESGTVPSAFAHQADILHFEPQGKKRDALLVVSVKSDAIDMQLDNTGNVYRAHLEVAAFVTDAQGRLLMSVRQEWPVERFADRGRLLPGEAPVFQQGLRLPPGRLTLTTAVRDTRTGRMSASRRALDVPEAPAGAALSSLVFIDRGEAVPDPAALAREPVAGGKRPLRSFPSPPHRRRHTRAALPRPGVWRPGCGGAAPGSRGAPGRKDRGARGPGACREPTARAGGPFSGACLRPPSPRAATSCGSWTAWATTLPRRAPPSRSRPVPTRPRPTRPAVSPALSPADPALATVLEKAGEYVVEYGDTFRDIVAEETYTQRAGGRVQNSRSDLVYVSTPGAIPWTCYRDVFEVNGQRVRDREARVEKLFLAESKASAVEKANAIIAESARYNFGWARRTINVPTLPLLFLHPANQERFRFERKGRRRFGDREAVEIALEEIQQPTLVNDGEGGDVPASGHVFVDALNGTVLRTDITFRFMPDRGLARLAAEYRFDPTLGLWLPAEMKEDYRNLYGTFQPVFRGTTEGAARYAKYRRFGVATEERVALPQK